ncbi:uncharacterized protein N7496_004666 [Penicillium cataractarum]|uniref:Major facilitator superfamily (MFS) profile domain-containing protein n=1 Tax=Penicillium cataractarum TaxID=2100454 RepID=A0A9W9SER0_9EURO|nr:uncharacterized protein N7496_004666 [Penicillium cataractarum]KAJ5377257.1 hypothetical protein N7496_004666 [Penicillium cataractarum]
MTEPEINNEAGEKPVATLIESTSPDGDRGQGEPLTENLVKSRFDEMSLGRTVWVFRRVALVSLAVYTGYVCEGFELKAGNSIVANAGFIKQFGNKNASGVAALDATWVSTWSSLLNVGQLVTLTYISWFAERFGRKPCFYLAWLWLVVGCAFLNAAKTPAIWALGKLCNGAGVGVLQSNAGSIISAVMMQQLNESHPDNYITAVRIIWAPIGLMIFFFIFVPESPWFYVRRGDKEKAMKSLRWLYGNVEGYDFDEEYNIIAKTIEHEREALAAEPKYIHLIQGVNLKRTLTITLLAVMGQLGGITIINTYSTYFFSLAGLSDPFLGTVIISCCNLLAVLIWALSTDFIGRRLLMNIFETIVVVILFVVGGLWWTGATTGNAAASHTLLVICCIWSFAFTFNSMAYYLMAAEIPSAILRVKTGPVSFCVGSVLGIATGYAAPPMLLALNLKSGFVFGAFSVPVCILMWLYIPETKGRSAAEIDELYERKIPVWRWSKTITSAEEQLHAVLLKKGGVD